MRRHHPAPSHLAVVVWSRWSQLLSSSAWASRCSCLPALDTHADLLLPWDKPTDWAYGSSISMYDATLAAGKFTRRWG